MEDALFAPEYGGRTVQLRSWAGSTVKSSRQDPSLIIKLSGKLDEILVDRRSGGGGWEG